jgi:hemolysin III
VNALVKPALRGVFHEAAFVLVVVLAVPLALSAEGGRAKVSAIVFSACLAGCFGASALYHRPTWTPRARSWLARLDHAGIYLLIAGTYTPFGLLVFSKSWSIPVLSIVYTGAALAILTKLFWVGAPKPFSASIAVLLGWVGIAAVTQLLKVGAAGFVLVVVGGALYTGGAVIYAFRRPNPKPTVFGYHELFHLCTIAAAACQYVAIAFFVLPRG